MRVPLSFVILSLSFGALLLMAISGGMPYWAWFIPVGIGIMATMALFRGSYLPQNAVARGLELIQAQDYNNRLVKVGEPNSDRIVALFNSLIDKLRAERLQNREQESLLKLLIEASPMGVVMLDFDNQVTMANKSFLKIFNITNLSEIEGKKINEIKGDLISQMIKVELGKSEIIKKGNYQIYRVYHLNFIQEGFKREFFLLESLTEEIMKAERAGYEKVIRTISHEVNNTMGGVRSILDTIRDHTEDEEIKEILESCSRRCDKMCDFIREYAEVVKLPNPILKPLDLEKEIYSMLPFLRQMSKEGITFTFKDNADDAIIRGDSAMIQQAIVNIVKNALDNIEDEGFIEINTNNEDGRLKLSIANNGLPISEDVSSKLFTPFFTTKKDGKGIGLMLVREVLMRHKGEYSLYTDQSGITRFEVWFPKF